MQEEMWRPYAKLNGFVEISNYGNVRNPKTDRVLRQAFNKSTGYFSVFVKPNGRQGKGKYIRVHRAVAETWIENPEQHPVVNHKDGNKLNNHVDNLEWCTYSHNSKHAYDLGLVSKIRKHKLDGVDFTDLLVIPRNREYGFRAHARRFGVSHATLANSVARFTGCSSAG